jgi:hypothetical protein
MLYDICRAYVRSWSAITKLLTPWNSVFLQKLTFTELVQKLISIHWNTCHCNTTSRLAALLSQINPVHFDPSCFFEVAFNIILLFKPETQSGLISSGFSTEARRVGVFSHMRATCSATIIHQSFGYRSNIMRLVLIQSPPESYWLLQLRPKYLPQHPIHKHP